MSRSFFCSLLKRKERKEKAGENIVEELWHNLKSGVFVNLILIVLFTLFFWQGTAISSYFVDIPIGSSGSRQADGLYYQLSYYYMSDNSREEFNAILKQLDDPFSGSADSV